MKKSLLALAVLGAFAGAASAQVTSIPPRASDVAGSGSQVQIYGVLDLAVTKGNGGTAATDANAGANGTSKAYLVKQSAASRLGFRGNEDIGGGWSAQFDLDHRFTPDDGNAGATFWGGRAVVAISRANIGTVYMGREYIPSFWPAVKTDPFGWDGVGQASLLQSAKYRATSGAVRSNNTAGARTASFGGLTVQAAYGFGEGANAKAIGGNVEYSAGPLYVGVGYDQLSDGPVVTQNDNQIINVGASYNFGFIKPSVYYAEAKTGALGVNKNTSMMFGLTAPLGPVKIKAVYGVLDPQGNDNDQTHVAIGFDYALSKRTGVYADYGQGAEKKGANAVTPSTNKAMAIGMKHTF